MNTQKERKKTLRFIVLVPHRDAGKLFTEYRADLFARGFPGAHSFPAAAPLAVVSKPFCREELKELAGNIREHTKKNDGKIRCGGHAQKALPSGVLPGETLSGQILPGGNLLGEVLPGEILPALPGEILAQGADAQNPEHGPRILRRSSFSGASMSEHCAAVINSFFGLPLNISAREGMFPETARGKILCTFPRPVLCAALVPCSGSPARIEGPALSFRAAALANLAIRPLPEGEPGYSYEWKTGPLVWLKPYKAGY